MAVFSGRRWYGSITDGCQTSFSSIRRRSNSNSQDLSPRILELRTGERLTCKISAARYLVTPNMFDGIMFNTRPTESADCCSWERSLGFGGFLPQRCLRWRAADCMYWSNALCNPLSAMQCTTLHCTKCNPLLMQYIAQKTKLYKIRKHCKLYYTCTTPHWTKHHSV